MIDLLSDAEIRMHYKHKCETGYDPLLCVHLTWIFPDGKEKHKYYHVDQVISEDRYVELIKKTQTQKISDLTDIDWIDTNKVWVPMQNATTEKAGVFWLKPTAKCKTLTDLYNQYEARIKIMFNGA